MAVKRPNGHRIYEHLALQDPPKFTQIGIVGSKIYHLATLLKCSSILERLFSGMSKLNSR
jgi:hypothetical protein